MSSRLLSDARSALNEMRLSGEVRDGPLQLGAIVPESHCDQRTAIGHPVPSSYLQSSATR